MGAGGRRFKSCCSDQETRSVESSPGHAMTLARIYKPTKTAMQSGRSKTKDWILDYEPEEPRVVGDGSSPMKSYWIWLEAAPFGETKNGLAVTWWTYSADSLWKMMAFGR